MERRQIRVDDIDEASKRKIREAGYTTYGHDLDSSPLAQAVEHSVDQMALSDS